jgi:hypothetical protein
MYLLEEEEEEEEKEEREKERERECARARERERVLASDAAIGFGGSRFISTKVHC